MMRHLRLYESQAREYILSDTLERDPKKYDVVSDGEKLRVEAILRRLGMINLGLSREIDLPPRYRSRHRNCNVCDGEEVVTCTCGGGRRCDFCNGNQAAECPAAKIAAVKFCTIWNGTILFTVLADKLQDEYWQVQIVLCDENDNWVDKLDLRCDGMRGIQQALEGPVKTVIDKIEALREMSDTFTDLSSLFK
jgi:hypothetical protein